MSRPSKDKAFNDAVLRALRKGALSLERPGEQPGTTGPDKENDIDKEVKHALDNLSNETINQAVGILLALRAGAITQEQSFERLFQLGVGMDDMETVLSLATEIAISRKRDEEHDLDRSENVIVCSGCNQLLNRFAVGQGDIIWAHPRPWVDYDHEPNPVEIPRHQFHGTACDFCGEIAPVRWLFIGEKMYLAALNEDGEQRRMDSMGDHFSACEDCGPLVRLRDYNGLWNRLSTVSEGTRYIHGEYEKVAKSPEELARLKKQHKQHTVNLWQTFIPTIHTVKEFKPPAKLYARMMPKLQQGLIKYWNYDGLYDTIIGKRGYPHSIPAVHVGLEDEFAATFPYPNTPTREQWTNHIQHLSAGIRAAELYWVKSNFVHLATMAGKDFEKLVITREELPAPFGFMIFEDPIGVIPRPGGEAAIRGFTWTLVPRGIWLNLYIQGEDGDPDVDVEDMRQRLGYLMCPNTGSGVPFGEEIPCDKLDDKLQFLRTIFATWFLMSQPGVAEHTTAPVDKKYARSYQRTNGSKLPDVRLVDLRRQPRSSTEPAETHEGRKYKFRVYRRGHWKRQFYGPGRSLRKTIYVNSYIAGPENAPLYERPATVKVVR